MIVGKHQVFYGPTFLELIQIVSDESQQSPVCVKVTQVAVTDNIWGGSELCALYSTVFEI